MLASWAAIASGIPCSTYHRGLGGGSGLVTPRRPPDTPWASSGLGWVVGPALCVGGGAKLISSSASLGGGSSEGRSVGRPRPTCRSGSGSE
eukprot:218326-Prymnesium_polylepis.1